MENKLEFFDFSDGKQISQEYKKLLTNETINHLIANPQEKFCYNGTGSFLCICLRENDGSIMVINTDSYKEARLECEFKVRPRIKRKGGREEF